MQDLIYLAVNVETSVLVAIFQNGTDCLNFVESKEGLLQVPFNSAKFPVEAANLQVGQRFVA